jgi:bla regulator protein blaR1
MGVARPKWTIGLGHGVAVVLALTLLIFNPTATLAQTISSGAPEPVLSPNGKPLTFEVVSVREENSVSASHFPVQIELTANGYRMEDVPLMAVIQTAYIDSQGTFHYGPNQIVGLPQSLAPIRYDIEAKISDADLSQWNDPALQPAMLRAMLQAMLVDRFKLEVHRDTKVVPIYQMTVGGKGPRFKTSEGATLAEIRQKHSAAHTLRSGAVVASGPHPGQLWLFGITMPALGEFLSTMAGRPVRDKTNLTGKYDLTYQIELPSSSPGDAANMPDFFSSQIVYVVEEQLGLNLKSAMGPMESLVIDHVEPPSGN